jgi:Family of unknown function (DUF5343)
MPGLNMTNADDTEKAAGKVTAPYVGFPTYKNMLSGFKENALPDRIDRSVLGKFSGIVGGQLLATLRFFDLIDQAGHPKPTLRVLVDAYGREEWSSVLAQHVRSAYSPLLSLKLESVSPAQFHETFRRSYAGEGDTSRKSISFFLSAAADAKIPISSYLLKNKKPRNGATKRKVKNAPSKPEAEQGSNNSKSKDFKPPPPPPADDTSKTIATQLLEKFPTFDPTWPDPIKTKWFEGYERLLSMGEKK